MIKFILFTVTLAIFTSGIPVHADETPADYPLTNCAVSGEKLGEHGKPVKVTHEGVDVYLCCKMCNKDFAKDPTKFTKMVKEAGPSRK